MKTPRHQRCLSCASRLLEHHPGPLCPACESRTTPQEDESIRSVIPRATRRQDEPGLKMVSPESTVDEPTLTLPPVDSEDGETGIQESDSTAAMIADLDAYFEEYEVVSRIARGGMGSVYLARQISVNREVALKILPFEYRGHPEMIERFRREAEAMGRLTDPGLIRIYDYGERRGLFFITMEYIRGDTLGEALPAMERRVDRIAVLLKICRAVSVLHEANLIHRDIKPSNIMVREADGEPVLMDLGLAKDMATEEETLTLSGRVMGTAYYMAPEQARGELDTISPATDVWSLGALMYEMLVGHPPFRGPALVAIEKARHHDVEPPRKNDSKLHRDLDTICMKALSHHPSERYAHAGELADDLEQFMNGGEIQARPLGWASRTWRRVRRQPKIMLGVGLMLFIGLLSVYAFLQSRVPYRLSALTGAFEQALQETDWSSDKLESMQNQVEQASDLHAATGAALQTKLRDGLVEHIQSRLSSARLGQEDWRRLEVHLKQLETIDPAAVPPLRTLADSRRSDWEPLLRLRAPFGNLQEVFDPGTVDRHPERLVIPSGQGAKQDRVATRIPTRLYMRMEARCDATWTNAHKLAVHFREPDGSGYSFRMRPWNEIKPSDVAGPQTFAQAIQDAGVVKLEIFRGKILIAESQVPITQVPKRGTRIQVMRAGNQLLLQIGASSPLQYEDIFPAVLKGGGQVWFEASPSLRITDLHVERKEFAATQSPLEAGDAAFGQENYEAALVEYASQALKATETVYALEARMKQALCLQKLNRMDESIAMLQTLQMADSQSRWSAIAACELWRIYLEQKNYPAAIEKFQFLSVEFSNHDLARIIPISIREDIARNQYLESGGFQFRPDPKRLERVKQTADILDLIGADSYKTRLAHWNLCRVYHSQGQLDKALKQGRAILNRNGLHLLFGASYEIPWILIQQGKQKEALRFIETWRKNGAPNGASFLDLHTSLLLDRARVFASLEKWEESLAALQAYEKEMDMQKWATDYLHIARYHVLAGLVAEARGDREAAIRAWTEGLQKEGRIQTQFSDALTGLELVFWTMLVSLTEEASDAEIREVIETALHQLPEGELLQHAKRPLFNHPGVIRTMWDGPENHRALVEIAVGKASLSNVLRTTGCLMAQDYILRAAFVDPIEADRAFVRDLTFRSYDAYIRGDLSKPQILPVLLAWKGETVAWSFSRNLLPAAFRSDFDYLLGHRFLKQGKKEAATTAWQRVSEQSEHQALRERSLLLMESTDK